MLSRDDLSDPERMIFDSVETGTRVDVDGADIRPELIVQLATSERAPGGGISRGVHASFAHFPAPLDLRGLTLHCPINLERCRFDHPVVADDARTVSLSLPDCELPSVSAGQLSVRGNLDLRGVHAEAVLLPGARVGGDLVLEAADLKRPGGLVFDASGLRVEHRLNCDGLRAHGRMLLRSARIGGPVLLANARLTGGGEVFDGTRMTIEESVLAEGLQVDGVLVLYGADVRGQVNLDRARMRNGGKDALAADGCRVGSLHAHEIYVQGGLRLTSAQVRDEVSLNGARLECPKGEASAYHVPVALLGDNLEIGSNLQLIGATVAGQLRLDRAHIGVSLVVVRTKLDNGEHVALHGADMHVGQRVFLLESQIRGDVVLSGARVDGMLDIGDTTFATGGSLDLRDARLGALDDQTWPAGDALALPARPYRPKLSGLEYGTLRDDRRRVAARLGAPRRDAVLPAGIRSARPDAAPWRPRERGSRRSDCQAARTARAAQASGTGVEPVLDWTVGYGYRTWRAIYALLAIIAIGWGVFAWASWDHMTPLRSAGELPQYAAWLYSLDAVLPGDLVRAGKRGGRPPAPLSTGTRFSVLSGWNPRHGADRSRHLAAGAGLDRIRTRLAHGERPPRIADDGE